MKRVGNLWPGLVSFSNLMGAAHDAAAGKRSRPDVATFLLNLETEVLQLQRELSEGSYTPGPYRTFMIRDPKPRLISAAPFRDRVVHHAFTRVAEPVFERRFSKDSFACRECKGTHAALEQAKRAARVYPYALKLDVRKYFASIDHEILKYLLERAIKCKPTLGLAARIIDGSNSQPDAAAFFAGDDLFSPHERRRGLPLGNQTSQFFANVYLDPVDQLVNRQWRPRAYVRYVDDLLVFDERREWLGEVREAVEAKLADLRLLAHAAKSRLYPVKDGVTFLGWRVFPGHTRLASGNAKRFRARMRRMQSAHAAGAMAWPKLRQRVNSWIAHAAHGDTWRLREQLLNEFSFRGDRCAV